MTPISEHNVAEKADSGQPTVSISGKPFDHLDISHLDRIKILDCGNSVLIVPATNDSLAPVLAKYGVYKSGSGFRASLFSPALEPLGVSIGDTVHTYARSVGIEIVRGDSG